MFSLFTKKERTWDFMHKQYEQILQSIENGTCSKQISLRISDKKDCKRLLQALRKDKTIENLDLDNFESLEEDDSDYEEFEGIGSNGIKEIAEILANNETWNSLDLSYNNIKDAGVEVLSIALKRNNTLKELEIRGNNITIKGLDELSKSLKDNVTLEDLDLSRNNIDHKGVEILSNNLEENLSLCWLNLSGNRIGDKGCKFLAKLIESHSRLHALDLSDNQIGTDGVVEIAKSMPKNIRRELTYLKLNKNTIGQRGFRMLAEKLDAINESNEEIVYHLELDETQIKAEEIKVFIETDAISSLALSNNQLGNADVKVFAEALAKNTSLEVIDLSKNQIDDDGASILIKALSTNRTLRNINLSDTKISDALKKEISDLTSHDKKSLSASPNKLKEKSEIILQEIFKKEKKILEESFKTKSSGEFFNTFSLKLGHLQKNIDALYDLLKVDPIAHKEQTIIDNHSDCRLKTYQERLGKELIRFMTCYFLAPAGVFQFNPNKKEDIISAIGSLPVGGILLKPLTCILSYASKKHRFSQINNISELFKDPAEIIRVCSSFSRKMTFARVNTIINQNEVDGIKKIYEDFKDIVEQQLKNLPVSDLTGVNLNSADRLAIFDVAFLLKEILSGNSKLEKDEDLVFQFLNLMKKYGVLEIYLNEPQTPLPNDINKNTYLISHDSRLELAEKHIQKLNSKIQLLVEMKEGKDTKASTKREILTNSSTFVNQNVVSAGNNPPKDHQKTFVPHFSTDELSTRFKSATICIGKDVMKNSVKNVNKK